MFGVAENRAPEAGNKNQSFLLSMAIIQTVESTKMIGVARMPLPPYTTARVIK